MQGSKDISFVADNSHYMFPFDSARFDEVFSFQPPIDIRAMLLTIVYRGSICLAAGSRCIPKMGKQSYLSNSGGTH
jgi:hypothetical protein